MSIRRERFKRLWPKRLEKALWHIQSIGKLSEKTNYIYEPGEVEAIKSQLNIALTEAMLRFDAGVANNIEEETNDAPNKALNALLYRVEKTEKENKLLKDQIKSIAVAKAIQSKHKNYQVLPNQELIALGVANIGGAFFQSFPTTGGFSRTAVNDQTGAKSGMASIFSAALIALTLLFLTPLFYYLPKAILASVIMVAVFGLIDFKEARHLWYTDRSDFFMMLATFLGTLILGIEEGIMIGVVLSLGLIIFRTTQPHTAVLGKIPGKPHYKNTDRFDHLEVRDDILIFRFDARLYFANVSFFKEKIEAEVINKGKVLKLFILDADSMNGIDSSGIYAIKEMIEFCHNQIHQL